MLTSGPYTAYPSTPQHGSTTIEVIGPLAILRNSDETRVFERSAGVTQGGNTYRLSHIAFAGSDQLDLSYRNGLISTISDPDGVMFTITRGRGGRIVSVQDRWGREVHYRYDANGLLQEATDIAGNAWSYEYAQSDRLIRAIGPNGRDILRIRYDEAGRVKESLSGRQYSFTYAPAETIVFEGVGHSHIFGHNDAGITDRFDSTNGVWWQLKLDDQHRVVEAYSSSSAHQYVYGREGQISRVVEQLTDGSRTREFQHDAQGRTTGVYYSDGAFTGVDYAGGLTRVTGPETEFAFDVLPSGQISQVRLDSTSVSAEYDPEGNLAAFRSGAKAVDFERDGLGRVSEVRYANGQVNRYRYDDLGNRASLLLGSAGGAVRYTHDPSGNIVEVAVTERNGKQKRQVVQIGDMNRVESITYEGAGTLAIGYDRMGRSVSFDMGSETIFVEYEGPDRIRRIMSGTGDAEWSPEDDYEAEGNTIEDMDARFKLMHGDSIGLSHQDYGIAGFDEFTFEMVVNDPMELAVSGLRDARTMLAVAQPLFSGDEIGAIADFEKPSNPVFQPLEYRSTNCCILIPTHMRQAIPDGRPFSDGTPGPSFCMPTPPTTGLPSYDPPERATIPVPEIDNTLGGEWGHYEIGTLNAHFSCRGTMESDVARLEGDVTGFVNKIKYRTTVPAKGNCTTGTRTSEQINRTIAHERKHADAWVEFVNSIRTDERLGVTYPDVEKCLLMRDALDKEFKKQYPEIAQVQANHTGNEFCGEERYTNHCPENAPPGTKATEVGTGTYYGSGNCN